METKKEWSFARALYHLTWMGYWTVAGFAILQILIFLHASFGEANGAFTFDANIMTERNFTLSTQDRNDSYIAILPIVKGQATIVLKNNSTISITMYLLAIKVFEFIAPFTFFYLLNLLTKNVMKKDPFNEKNARYLFAMGCILVGSEAIAFILALPQISLIHFFNLPEGIQALAISPNSYGSILLGITAIVFGYVFKEATRIHEEQKLTV